MNKDDWVFKVGDPVESSKKLLCGEYLMAIDWVVVHGHVFLAKAMNEFGKTALGFAL